MPPFNHLICKRPSGFLIQLKLARFKAPNARSTQLHRGNLLWTFIGHQLITLSIQGQGNNLCQRTQTARQHLKVQHAIQVSICGQLRHQNPAILIGISIGVGGHNKPCASDQIINHKARTILKLRGKRGSAAHDHLRTILTFCTIRWPVYSNGQPTVIRELGKQVKQERVVGTRKLPPFIGLVPRRAR